ncbi:MAG: hypothetical protein U0610_27110 [bacterium]
MTKPTGSRRPEPAPAPAPKPSKAIRFAQYLTSLAVPATIAVFWWRYHVVLPSDDVFSMRVLRKEHGGFNDTVVFVGKFVDDYNRSGAEAQAEIEKRYLYRRLVNTGIVRRAE